VAAVPKPPVRSYRELSEQEKKQARELLYSRAEKKAGGCGCGKRE
jgi:hypothetical protein